MTMRYKLLQTNIWLPIVGDFPVLFHLHKT